MIGESGNRTDGQMTDNASVSCEQSVRCEL